MVGFIAKIFGYVRPNRFRVNVPFSVFGKKGRFILRINGYVQYWSGKTWKDHSVSLIGLKESKWYIKYER